MKEKYTDADGKPCTHQEWLELQGLTLEDSLEWQEDQRQEAIKMDNLYEDELWEKARVTNG